MRRQKRNAREDEPDEQSNAHVEFLLGTIWMTDTQANPKESQAKGALSPTEKLVAATIKNVLKKHWKKSITLLSDRSGISEASIYKLKKFGANKVTPSLRDLCDFLRIEDEAVLRGKIVKIDQPQIAEISNDTDDVAELANAVKGGPDEDLARQFLKRLRKGR